MIPPELTDCKQWVCWCTVSRNGKPTKMPINAVTGKPAACNDPTSWADYQTAEEASKARKLDGIGFVFTDRDPYSGVDLDHCRDPETGQITPWAWDIIKSLDSYTEVSPSQTGVKIFLRATLPSAARNRRAYEGGNVEMYSRLRFFTTTGQHLEGTHETVNERQVELLTLHARLFTNHIGKSKAVAETRFSEPVGPSSSINDSELIKRAASAGNGAKFSRLWAGDWRADYASQSEADLALCTILAFWTARDAARIDVLFRRSTLYRDKWDDRHGSDGRTYGQITMDKAIEQTSEVWSRPGHSEKTNPEARKVDQHFPTIVVNERQLREVTDDALKALEAANDPPVLFVRTGEVVQIKTAETGRTAIDVVTETQLRARLAEISNTVRLGKKAEVRDCFPPLPVIENILALHEWPFPPLHSIVEVPVLRPDGSVLSKPGYDSTTRLFYSPPPDLKVAAVPDAPSGREVADALRLIDEVIGEFPFVDDASRANTLGTALTPILRPAIKGPTPLGLIDAPQAGTGKGLLAEVIALIATGRAAAMMAAPHEEDEWRKHLTAVLSSGASVITIDNVEHRLASAPLAVVLTAREWTGRILGLSKTITVPVRVTWIANGNNVRLGGDIPRRCYYSRLDAKVSRPWKRTGFKHPELLDWVSEHRGELLVALLTLARAWYAAGKPEAPVPVMGSFEEWAGAVGGILHYAGTAGFLANLEEMYESSDESTSHWEAFLQALATAFGDHCFTVKQVTERIPGDAALGEAVPDDLVDALEQPGSFQRRLGHAFSKRVGTRYGDPGIHLERDGEKKHATRWRMVLSELG